MASQRDLPAKWTESITNLLVSLLVDEVRKGNRTSSTYNKAGWRNIVNEFNKQSGLTYDRAQLRNKVNKLKRQFGSFKRLLSQSGFGWDDVNKTVVVDDPSIWEAHIKDNREWAKFKINGFPQYPDLCIVFGDTYATEEYATGNAEDLMVEGEGKGANNAHGGPEDSSEYHTDDEVFASMDGPVAPVHDTHDQDRTPNIKRRRNSKAHDLSTTYKALQDMIESRRSQSASGSITSQSSAPPVDPYSVAAVIGILSSMLELEQDLYNKAVDRACSSAPWREAFITSPPERRIGLLYNCSRC